MRVTIVGAGLMGAQIGCEYALGGHEVMLVARRVDAVDARVEAAFHLLEDHGLAAAEDLRAARARIVLASSLDGDASLCDLAVESVPEELALKAELLRRLSDASPEAILASNTSSLSITGLGDAVGEPERVVGTHYLNPPLLMPPVELIAGNQTEPSVVDAIHRVLVALGKQPVLVRRDVPGFVWNRLQFALLRECTWIVDAGVASADDVDRVVREGLARRWRRVGPFAAIGLAGVQTANRAAANIVPDLSGDAELGDLTRFAETDPAELGRLRAQRDAGLADELRG